MGESVKLCKSAIESCFCITPTNPVWTHEPLPPPLESGHIVLEGRTLSRRHRAEPRGFGSHGLERPRMGKSRSGRLGAALPRRLRGCRRRIFCVRVSPSRSPNCWRVRRKSNVLPTAPSAASREGRGGANDPARREKGQRGPKGPKVPRVCLAPAARLSRKSLLSLRSLPPHFFLLGHRTMIELDGIRGEGAGRMLRTSAAIVANRKFHLRLAAACDKFAA